MEAIVLEHVDFDYERPRQPALPVLRDINLTLLPATICAILGPTGCGKSTILNLVAGLLVPRQGRVRWPDHISRRCGYVFQSPTLLPWRTLRSNALFGAQLAGLDPAQSAELCADLLERYGLSAFATSFPAALSGGMQQRLSLIRAILAGGRVLLLDEPFSNIDVVLRRQLQSDLAQVVEERRLLTLMVTHDVEEAVMLADTVVVLSSNPASICREIAIPEPRAERLGARPAILAGVLPVLSEIWDALSRSADTKSAVHA